MFKQYIGQTHLVGPNMPIDRLVQNKFLQSMIFHGPPGIGKTTLANLIGNNLKIFCVSLNAATSSTDDIRKVLEYRKMHNTIIIIMDEIHRLDKKKQDYLLPFTETNEVIIIGTTTENPYYAVSSALKSRMLVFELKKISDAEMLVGLQYHNYLLDPDKNLDQLILTKIAAVSNGDVRSALNILKFLLANYQTDEITPQLISSTFSNNAVYDKNQAEHHNLISAFQKSIRASDLDAALHYTARLITFGDIDSILRRLIIICYEDIGLANPSLCSRTVSMVDGFHYVGMPEGRILISNIVVEMSLSPKSTSAYNALDRALADIEDQTLDLIPEHIKKHQEPQFKYSPQNAAQLDNLPRNLKGKKYFVADGISKYEKYYYEQYLIRKQNIKTRIYPLDIKE